MVSCESTTMPPSTKIRRENGIRPLFPLLNQLRSQRLPIRPQIKLRKSHLAPIAKRGARRHKRHIPRRHMHALPKHFDAQQSFENDKDLRSVEHMARADLARASAPCYDRADAHAVVSLPRLVGRHDWGDDLAEAAVEVLRTPIAGNIVWVHGAVRKSVVPIVPMKGVVCGSVLKVVVKGIIDRVEIEDGALGIFGVGRWERAVRREGRVGGVGPWCGDIEVEGLEPAGGDEGEELGVGLVEAEGVVLKGGHGAEVVWTELSGFLVGP